MNNSNTTNKNSSRLSPEDDWGALNRLMWEPSLTEEELLRIPRAVKRLGLDNLPVEVLVKLLAETQRRKAAVENDG